MDTYMKEQESMGKYEEVPDSEEEELSLLQHHQQLWESYQLNQALHPQHHVLPIVHHVASCQPLKHNPAIERQRSYMSHTIQSREMLSHTTEQSKSESTTNTCARELQDFCPIAYSQTFLIPKPSDPTKLRVLADLKKSKVNNSVRPKHFQSDKSGRYTD